MFDQHAEGPGLNLLRMGGQEMIAEEALLFVTDPVSLQHVLAALRALTDEAWSAW